MIFSTTFFSVLEKLIFLVKLSEKEKASQSFRCDSGRQMTIYPSNKIFSHGNKTTRIGTKEKILFTASGRLHPRLLFVFENPDK